MFQIVLVIKKVKNTVPWIYIVGDPNDTEKGGYTRCQWKGYNNSFNS